MPVRPELVVAGRVAADAARARHVQRAPSGRGDRESQAPCHAHQCAGHRSRGADVGDRGVGPRHGPRSAVRPGVGPCPGGDRLAGDEVASELTGLAGTENRRAS